MIWSEFSQFHFIRPLWLLGIPALFILWWVLARLRRTTHWEAFIPKQMLEALQVSSGRYSKSWQRLLMLAWLLAVVGAAGPSWKQIEMPTVRNESAMVIVLDLSQSMLAQDLTPDRLSRAKYKLIDLLRTRTDGQTALVVYAGDAHTVAPLTDDTATIEVLLPALHPAIMPITGSNTEAAVALAEQLMHDAGVTSGQIIIFTDGIADQASETISSELNANHALSVLAVGSTESVPIPNAEGGFVRDAAGDIVLVDVDRPALRDLAQRHNGRFADIQTDDSDIQALTGEQRRVSDTAESALVYDSWEDMGYWIVLLILPFAAFSFRKGIFFLLPLTFVATHLSPQSAQAMEWEDLSWGKMWKTPDQHGALLLENGDPKTAAETFERNDWAGVANYRAGDFNQAAERFNSMEGAQAQYNVGNSLAFAGQLEQAIDAYDQALAADPTMEDAQHNKEVVEQLLQQQDENQQQNSEQHSSSERSDQQQPDQSQPDQQQAQNSDQQNEQGQRDPSQAENGKQQDEQETADSEPEQQQNEDEEQAFETQMVEAAEADPDKLDESSERWLRGIPDDPSGFLRRKFEYESARRQQQQRSAPYNQPPGSERY